MDRTTPAEGLLYLAARKLYRTQIAHTDEMKQSVQSADCYDRFRAKESAKMLDYLERHNLSLMHKVVVDFGCNDGAMSAEYLKAGASQVIGVDIDAKALERARQIQGADFRFQDRLSFRQNTVSTIPIEPNSVDTVLSFDVLEHVARPLPILRELHRILKPGGQAVIGTIGWRMPFSPHLWSVMPVPWAHVLVSEKTLLKVCRRVYHSRWYEPNMHDYDALGNRKVDKFVGMEISRDYLNHYLVRDFERDFRAAGFRCRTDIIPLHGLAVLKPLRYLPWVREFVGGSVWFVVEK